MYSFVRTLESVTGKWMAEYTETFVWYVVDKPIPDKNKKLEEQFGVLIILSDEELREVASKRPRLA